MANKDQLRILRKGAWAWNKWRKENLDVIVDLSEANLNQAILMGANLSGAHLGKADLGGAHLNQAILIKADLGGANLCGADLRGADLRGAKLSDADLSDADLSRASLIETTLVRTKLTGCRIYGISAWGLKLDEAEQKDLVITPEDQPTITVDNIEVAQFIYLLLQSDKMRRVIDTLTAKAVLILGRFTSKRKAVLDAIREELRKHNYVPILFDFEKPASRNLTETVSTLAHMARFVIADITDARSIPAELAHIVPDLPSVPVQPLILDSDYEYALFEHIREYPWVLDVYRYKDQQELIASIEERVIDPAEAKVNGRRPP